MVPQSLSDSYKKIRSADNSRQNTPTKFQTKKVFGKRPGTTSPTGEPVKPVCVKHFLARKKEYGLAQVIFVNNNNMCSNNFFFNYDLMNKLSFALTNLTKLRIKKETFIVGFISLMLMNILFVD